eukprot:7119732-Alexandrium_andersonii.AAC.1
MVTTKRAGGHAGGAFRGVWGAEPPGKTQCARQSAIRQSVIRQSALRLDHYRLVCIRPDDLAWHVS